MWGKHLDKHVDYPWDLHRANVFRRPELVIPGGTLDDSGFLDPSIMGMN